MKSSCGAMFNAPQLDVSYVDVRHGESLQAFIGILDTTLRIGTEELVQAKNA